MRRRDEKTTGNTVTKYSYRNSTGEEVFQVVRMEPKGFRQRRRGPKGGWIWDTHEVKKPLYRLPELLAAKPNRTVYVPEGEKDVDALAELGFVTTTNPGGAGKWKSRYSKRLQGRKVVVLADNDEVGKGHARKVAESLLPFAKSVRVVGLPGLPEHGDVSDWLEAGGTATELKRIVEETERFRSQKAQSNGIRFRTPPEMLRDDPVGIDWIWEHFVAAGAITDVVGKVKIAGKTTLCTFLAAAVIRGQDFLGKKTLQSPVVYLNEQPEASFREALLRAGLQEESDFSFLLWHEVRGKSLAEITKAAIAECKARGARLLIIDTLPQFAGLGGSSENDSGSALEVMNTLQEATAAGIAIITVRHARKMGGEISDSARGSSAFSAGADTLITVSRTQGRGNRVRVLEAVGRFDGTPHSTLIELTPQGYVSLGTVGPIAQEKARNALETALPGRKSEALTMDELISETGNKRPSLQRALEALEQQGRVRKIGKGVRNDPHRYWQVEKKEGEKGKERKIGKEDGKHE